MYEILHPEAPNDELDFYLSYAEKNMVILEPMCGTERFLVPFLEHGYNIEGMDSSFEMLAKLNAKAPDSKFYNCDILNPDIKEKYDYIFISSGSVSLFTDMNDCRKLLQSIRKLMKKNGIFVFAVDTLACRCSDNTSISVKTKEGFELILKSNNHYDEKTHTQYSPGIYELYDGEKLLQQESMDFQTHLYDVGEIDPYLREAGFTHIKAYSSYERAPQNKDSEMILYECS